MCRNLFTFFVEIFPSGDQNFHISAASYTQAQVFIYKHVINHLNGCVYHRKRIKCYLHIEGPYT